MAPADFTTGARPVKAARGTELTAKSWQTEAPLRMLMNNLDPEVAERPDDLVVYGGTGRAVRSWAAFDAITRTLETMEKDETLLVQSGKPVGVFRTNEWAPRVLLANSNLVGDWANWPEFRRLEAEGLMMYGQMTAGSWIYIGTQGILQGTFETFAAIARKLTGDENGTLAGTLTLTGGCGGMGGAQPLAVTLNDGACLIVDVDESRLRRRAGKRYLDEVETDLDTAIAKVLKAKEERRGWSVGYVGNAAEVFPEILRRHNAGELTVDIVTDQTSAHDPLSYLPEGITVRGMAPRGRRRSRKASPRRPRPRWPSTSRPWSSSRTPAPRSSTTATPSATRPARAATTAPSNSPASSRPTSARCSARASARSAGWPSPATPRTSRSRTRPSRSSSPRTSTCTAGSTPPPERVEFEGLPARICWLGYGERAKAGLLFNQLVKEGKVKAPIVIGRDHLDSGSVASPYRETEAMADGSDAIADWPLLNALLNTASGATWVSLHHGGGVGIGRSIHAGQVSVADGTDLAAQKLERLLTNDPGMGVIRHADAGYDRAVEVAKERGVRIPMSETP